ncbi:nuclear transcription factor Y subunit gamma-like [Amphiura filiformis]|uniref:nuclear transcription factor Y subunit gamma-like n=1 Tax=Amphiura filiformis TaxID=82378 RepID=UPI003B21F841
MESNGNTPSSSSGPSEAQERHNEFWPKQMELIRNMKNTDFKTQELPLARIKKIMKLDEDVKMISAEAPVLFSKAAEIFIGELSLRAWLHTEENKRRTLQRNDIAMAITKYDQFDFLIDIVPRDELKPQKRPEGQVQQATMMPDQVQYYFQLAQNQQAQQTTTQQQTATTAASTVQTAQAGQAGQQILVTTPGGQQQYITIAAPSTSGQTQQVQTVTVSNNDNQVQLLANQQGNQSGAAVPVQLQAAQGTNLQQLVTNTGEVQQVQFSPQIQYVRQAQGNQQTNQTELGQTVYQIQQVPIQNQSGQVTQQVFLQQAGGDATSATGTTQVQLTEQA